MLTLASSIRLGSTAYQTSIQMLYEVVVLCLYHQPCSFGYISRASKKLQSALQLSSNFKLKFELSLKSPRPASSCCFVGFLCVCVCVYFICHIKGVCHLKNFTDRQSLAIQITIAILKCKDGKFN